MPHTPRRWRLLWSSRAVWLYFRQLVRPHNTGLHRSNHGELDSIVLQQWIGVPLMKPLRSLAAWLSSAAILAASLIAGSAPANASGCEINTWSEVDGYHGVIIFYPSFRCSYSSVSASMATFPSNGGNQWSRPSAGVWYSGTGVQVPIQGSGQYCVQIDLAVYTSGVQSYSSRPCIWL